MKKFKVLIFTILLMLFLLPINKIEAMSFDDGSVQNRNDSLIIELDSVVKKYDKVLINVSITNPDEKRIYNFGSNSENAEIIVTTNKSICRQTIENERLGSGTTNYKYELVIDGVIKAIDFINIYELDSNYNVINNTGGPRNCDLTKATGSLVTQDLLTFKLKNILSFIDYNIVTLTIDNKDNNNKHAFVESCSIEIITDKFNGTYTVEPGNIELGSNDSVFFLKFKGNIESIKIKDYKLLDDTGAQIESQNIDYICDISKYKIYHGFNIYLAAIVLLMLLSIIFNSFKKRHVGFGKIFGSFVVSNGLIVSILGALLLIYSPLETQVTYQSTHKSAITLIVVGVVFIAVGSIVNKCFKGTKKSKYSYLYNNNKTNNNYSTNNNTYYNNNNNYNSGYNNNNTYNNSYNKPYNKSTIIDIEDNKNNKVNNKLQIEENTNKKEDNNKKDLKDFYYNNRIKEEQINKKQEKNRDTYIGFKNNYVENRNNDTNNNSNNDPFGALNKNKVNNRYKNYHNNFNDNEDRYDDNDDRFF